MAFSSMDLCVSGQISFFLKKDILGRSHLQYGLDLITSAKSLFPNKGTFTGTGDLNTSLWETRFNVQQRSSVILRAVFVAISEKMIGMNCEGTEK